MLSGVKLGVQAGLAHPKPHPAGQSLQCGSRSKLGAELGLDAQGESKAKPLECVGWGAGLTKWQKAGFQLELFSPLLKVASSSKAVFHFLLMLQKDVDII